MKQTEIGEVPEEWSVVPLDDLATPLMGQSPPSQYVSSEKSDGSLPFYQGNSEFDGKYLGAPKAYCSEPTRIAEANSVLISVRAPVGAVSITKERISIGRGLAALSCNSCNPDFLFYYLLANEPRWERIKQGSTFESVNKKEIHGFLIATPKIEEQNRIASILSCVDSAISETDEIIEKSRTLKKGMMQELLTRGIGHTKFKQTEIGEVPVGWAVKRISEVCKKPQYGYTASSDIEFNGPKYLRITDIQNGGVNWSAVPNCKISDEELAQYILTDEDIVFARTGATTGKSYLIHNPPQAVFASVLIRLRATKINPQFLSQIFKSQIYWSQIHTLKGDIVRGGINGTILQSLSVPIPKPEEQAHIASILSSADSKIESELEKRAQLELLKKGLMQDLLTGRVRVGVN